MSCFNTHPSREVRAEPSELAFAVLGAREEQRSPGNAHPPSEQTELQTAAPSWRKKKGERMSGQRRGTRAAGIAPERRGEACRAWAQLSIAMGQHPASL